MKSPYNTFSNSSSTLPRDLRPSDPSPHDVHDFSFAAIDPMKTVPQDRQEADTHISIFQEPTFNFDDFHDTIRTNNGPSLSHFPLPGGGGPIQVPEVPSIPQIDQRKISQQSIIPVPTRKVSNPGGVSLSRKGSTASTAGRTYLPKGDILVTSAPGTSAALRGRRQSNFPPNAFNNINPAPPKAPRKSIGPGTFVPPENEEIEVKRRPSPGGRKSSAGSDKSGKMARTQAQGGREGSKSPRNVKTKSILVPSRKSSKDLLTPSRTPDLHKTLSLAGQTTPGKQPSGTPGRATSPGGSRRMSVAPGHATGLGARTISPTDARRMKRMSMMPSAPPVPHRRISQAPPTPQPEPIIVRPRSTVQSPVAQNRKSLTTPSSSRTTPDPNRKSYSSGQSLSSSTSYNSATRNLANPMLRGAQNTSTSRLPTPKPRIDHEDEVPPVPAIPKSYDSPASELDQPFFSARSSGLSEPDSPSEGESPIAADLAKAMAMMDLPQPPSDSSSRTSQRFDQPDYPDQSQVNKSSKVFERNKTNYPNLRLPPINLLPLSTPTAIKIKSFKDSIVGSDRSLTPPGARGIKTPSTPMTASKATFFARNNRGVEEPQHSIRSSTSHYALRNENSLFDKRSPVLPNFSFEADAASHRSISPYISSSLPKASDDLGSLMRPKFNTELKRSGTQQSGCSTVKD